MRTPASPPHRLMRIVRIVAVAGAILLALRPVRGGNGDKASTLGQTTATDQTS